MPNDSSKYDATLNTIGLIYQPDGETQTRLLPLRPVKQDSGNNPNEIRPEYGDYFSQSNFIGGAGQPLFHGPESRKSAYYKSDGFDLRELGVLKHLLDVKTSGISNYVQGAEVVGDVIWTIDTGVGSGTVKKASALNVASLSWTSDHPGVGCSDLTTSGLNIYAAAGANGIRERSDASGTWSTYRTGTVDVVAWLKDRLIAAQNTVTAGNAIYEVASGGGGALPTALETLPRGWKFGAPFEAGPYIYAPAYQDGSGRSRIHIFGLAADASALEKRGYTSMPEGVIITGGFGYLDSVYLVGFSSIAQLNSAGSSIAVVMVCYKAVIGKDGFLNYSELHRADDAFPYTTANNTLPIKPRALGTEVYIPWTETESATTGWAGVLCYDVARESLARCVEHGQPYDSSFSQIRVPRYTNVYRGMIFVAGKGEKIQDGHATAHYVASAELTTSIADFTNAGLKSWDLIEIKCNPLPAGTSIQVYYTTSHPDENVFTLVGTLSTADAEGATFALANVTSRIFALKIVSNANGGKTVGPEFLGFSVRSHPKPTTPNWILTRTIRIASVDRKNANAEVVFQNPDTILEQIEDLAYTPITFYEDRATWTARIESIETVEPAQPVLNATTGEPLENIYILRLTMIGTRG